MINDRGENVMFLRNLIITSDFIVLNNLEKSDKGPWTWMDRNDNNIKSCLDIAKASTALLSMLK